MNTVDACWCTSSLEETEGNENGTSQEESTTQ